MKRFAKNILVAVVPFGLMVVLVNYFIDPANVYSSGKYEDKIADIILKGHNAGNLRNFDERHFLQRVVTEINYKPDLIVMGTSRSMIITREFFHDTKFLNCSVSHGNINDFLAIIGLLDSTQKLPKEIYIETSPTFLGESLTDEWMTLHNYRDYAVHKIGIDDKLLAENKYNAFVKTKMKLDKIISLGYFQNCISSLQQGKMKPVKDFDTSEPRSFGRKADCSITRPDSYYKPDTVKAMADAKIYIERNKLPVINATYLQIFKSIILYLKSKGVKITLLNLPFQTDCYHLMEAKNKTFITLQQNIIDFAKEMNVDLKGVFNPDEAGLQRIQFFDPLHCDKKGTMKVFDFIKYTAKM